MTDKPTKAQIKEFWKWCGAKETIWHKIGATPLRSIDLNNLFEYATDRVKGKIGEKEYFKLLVRWCEKVAQGESPTDTLFALLYAQTML